MALYELRSLALSRVVSERYSVRAVVSNQLVLLARVGLSIRHVQGNNSDDEREAAMLQYLAGEAAKLAFLHEPRAATATWLDTVALCATRSLNDLMRCFASALQRAWPVALVRTLSRLQMYLSRATSAVIVEPAATWKEPREVVALWPFTVRARSVVEHAGDLSRLVVKVRAWVWRGY